MDYGKTKFYIFRHGQTFATKNSGAVRFGAFSQYGRRIFSAPILEEGKPALERMGMYLKDKHSDINLSSPFVRCRQTAGVIENISGKSFVFDRRLGEYLLETFGYFRNRIKSVLDFVERQEYHSVVICTHGAVIGVLVNLILGREFNWRSRLQYPDPGVLIIIENGEYKEIDFRKS